MSESDTVTPSTEDVENSNYATKKLLDVACSQLLDEKEYLEHSEKDVDGFLNAPQSAGGVNPRVTSSGSSSQRPHSMPLHSIAKSERLLKRNIPLLKQGTQVQFSKEDIAHIHDRDILSFLEEHSQMFSKYITEDKDHQRLDTVGEGENDEEKESSSVGIAERIEDLQKEIDFFITAVDQDGKTYKIELDEDGNIVLPVEDDTEFDNEDHNLIIEEGADVEEEEDLYHSTEMEEGDEAPAGEEESEETNYDVSSHPKVVKGARLQRPRSDATGVSQGEKKTKAKPPAKKKDKKEAVVKSKTTSVTVKIPQALTPAEEQRATVLLKEDLENGEHAITTNPFSFPSEVVERLERIDAALEQLRRLRQPDREVEEEVEAGEEAEEEEENPPPSTEENTTTSRYAKGTAQMKQAIEDAKRERKLQGINQKLLKLQEEMNNLTLFAPSAEGEALQELRPEWARGPVLPSEEEVQALLSLATAEEERARRMSNEEGAASTVDSPAQPTEEPYFLSNLRTTLSSALGLLEESAASPLERKEWTDEEIKEELVNTYGKELFED